MVVCDDHVDPHLPCPCHCVAAGDTAVHCDKDTADTERLKRFVKGFRSEAVTIIKAVGNEGVYDCAVAAENPRQKRTGGNTVSVIITMDQNRLFVGNSFPQPRRRFPDPRETVGVAQISEPRIQETFHLIRTDAARGKKEGYGTGEIETPLQSSDFFLKISGVDFPLVYTHLFLFSYLIFFINITPKLK